MQMDLTRYFLDALKVINDEKVKISFTCGTVHLTPVEHDGSCF